MSREDHSKRKQQHLEGCLALARRAMKEGRGELFPRHRLLLRSFPDLDLAQVDPSVRFLGKRLALPFMLGAMTGGFPGGDDLNLQLARHANADSTNIGFRGTADEDHFFD